MKLKWLFFLLGYSISFGQTLKVIEPGDGTLSKAIASAESGDILQLKSGGIYTISTESGFGKIKAPLTIQVEPGAEQNAVLKLGTGASITKKYYFFEINDGAALTLKGLDINGLLDGNTIVASMLIFDARPNPSEARIGNFVFQDCSFHDFKDYIVHGMKDDYARGLIQDSVFIDNVIVYNAKHFLQYKHVSLRHLEMTNSTIYDLTRMALKIGKIGYRCVLQNPYKPYIPITDETITPTGFIDHCTLNNLGNIHGHVQVDEAYHTFHISNCIISNQQQFNQPPIYFNESTINDAVFLSNICFWNTDNFNDVDHNIYNFNDVVNSDPQFENEHEGDFSLPLNSPLLTFDDKGGIIGDPRWMTYTLDIKPVAEYGDISFNCYPNPFKQNLNIEYMLKTESSVTIRIYNILGIEVAVIKSDNELPGKHHKVWNVNNYKSGFYLCTINTSDAKASKKVILN